MLGLPAVHHAGALWSLILGQALLSGRAAGAGDISCEGTAASGRRTADPADFDPVWRRFNVAGGGGGATVEFELTLRSPEAVDLIVYKELDHDPAVRLVSPGGDPSWGRLEVKHDRGWRSVCDKGSGGEGFTNKDAEVVCRELGMSGGTSLFDDASELPDRLREGAAPLLMSHVRCTGTEGRLLDCPHWTEGAIGGCGGHTWNAAAVRCIHRDVAVQTGPAMFSPLGDCGNTAADGNCISNNDHLPGEDCSVTVAEQSVLSATFFDTYRDDELTMAGATYAGVNTGHGGDAAARGPQGVPMAAGSRFEWKVGTNWLYEVHDGWTICRAAGRTHVRATGLEAGDYIVAISEPVAFGGSYDYTIAMGNCSTATLSPTAPPTTSSPTPAPTCRYVEQLTGTCPAGTRFIETDADCEAAAASLGLKSTTVGNWIVDDDDVNLPHGCYFKKSGRTLWRNPTGDRSGTDTDRVSLCTCSPPTGNPTTAPTTTPTATTPTTAPTAAVTATTTAIPTPTPITAPTATPTSIPTANPTPTPTATPTAPATSALPRATGAKPAPASTSTSAQPRGPSTASTADPTRGPTPAAATGLTPAAATGPTSGLLTTPGLDSTGGPTTTPATRAPTKDTSTASTVATTANAAATTMKALAAIQPGATNSTDPGGGGGGGGDAKKGGNAGVIAAVVIVAVIFAGAAVALVQRHKSKSTARSAVNQNYISAADLPSAPPSRGQSTASQEKSTASQETYGALSRPRLRSVGVAADNGDSTTYNHVTRSPRPAAAGSAESTYSHLTPGPGRGGTVFQNPTFTGTAEYAEFNAESHAGFGGGPGESAYAEPTLVQPTGTGTDAAYADAGAASGYGRVRGGRGDGSSVA